MHVRMHAYLNTFYHVSIMVDALDTVPSYAYYILSL